MIKKLKSNLKTSELVKGSSISFGLRIIGIGIGYIFTLLISNHFGAEAMGLYALSFVLLQIVSMIGRMGMDMALIKFIAEYKTKQQAYLIKELYLMVVKLIFPIATLLSAIIFYLSPYIAKYIFDKEKLSLYFQLASFGIVPYTFILINSESLRGLQKIKEYMFLQNISTTLIGSTLLLVSLAYSLEDLFVPVLALIIAIYITCGFSIWIWSKNLSNLVKDIKSSINVHVKGLLTYQNLFSIAIPMTLTSYLAIVMGSADTIMLGMYATEKDVGIYSVVLKLVSMSLIVFMAVNTFTVPKFSAYWGEKNLESIRTLSYESTKLILYLSLPIFIAIWLFPSWVLSIFGEEFREGMSALMIMSIGQFLYIIAGPVWNMMNMTNKQKTFFYFSLLSATTNIALNYMLIPIYGLDGAAFATVTGGVVLNVLSILYIKKEFGFLTIYVPFSSRDYV